MDLFPEDLTKFYGCVIGFSLTIAALFLIGLGLLVGWVLWY